MFILGNALHNLVRYKGRYLLIGGILIVLLASITVGSMIHCTAKALIRDYADRFGVAVSFTPDLRKLIAQTAPDPDGYFHDPEITPEQYLAFSHSDTLQRTLFQGSRQTYCAALQGLDQGGEEAWYASGAGSGFTSSTPHPGETRRQAPNTLLLGYSDTGMLQEFAMGLRELDEGRFFSAPGECLVSRNLADLNHLQLGDSFVLQDVNRTDVPPLSLTVCGIYLDITPAQSTSDGWAVNNRRNEILTDFATLAEHSTAGLLLTVTYYLKSPALAPQFEAYVREKGLDPIFNITVDAEPYNQIVQPVQGLQHVSGTFLAVILLVGAAVLVFLSVLGVRERKYEIGVLRAMGMSKGQAVLGLVWESVFVMLLCLCIGLGVGSAIAQPVSDALLAEQAAADNQPDDEAGILSNTGEGGETAPVSQSVPVGLAPESFGWIAAAAVLLCLLTNLCGVLAVLRYEPMTILTERI